LILKLLKLVLGRGFDPCTFNGVDPVPPVGRTPRPPSTNVEPPNCYTIGPALICARFHELWEL